MRKQARRTRADAVTRAVAGATLLLFLLRALIPVGFMPETRADGRLELVICSSSGENVVHVVDLGAPDERKRSKAGDDCPYSLAFGKNFTPPGQILAPVVRAPVPEVNFARDVARLIPPALGPPVGQRAPPNLLV